MLEEQKRRNSTLPFLSKPNGLTLNVNFKSLVFHYLSIHYVGVEAKYILD